MKQKSFFTLLLLTAMIFGVTGCSKEDGNDDEKGVPVPEDGTTPEDGSQGMFHFGDDGFPSPKDVKALSAEEFSRLVDGKIWRQTETHRINGDGTYDADDYLAVGSIRRTYCYQFQGDMLTYYCFSNMKYETERTDCRYRYRQEGNLLLKVQDTGYTSPLLCIVAATEGEIWAVRDNTFYDYYTRAGKTYCYVKLQPITEDELGLLTDEYVVKTDNQPITYSVEYKYAVDADHPEHVEVDLAANRPVADGCTYTIDLKNMQVTVSSPEKQTLATGSITVDKELDATFMPQSELLPSDQPLAEQRWTFTFGDTQYQYLMLFVKYGPQTNAGPAGRPWLFRDMTEYYQQLMPEAGVRQVVTLQILTSVKTHG